MKKFLILLPAFLLIGCSGAKNVSFKDNLKYDEPLDATQLETFDKNFKEASKKVKTLKVQSETEEMHGFVERTTSGEGTYTLFTNGSKFEVSGKIDSKDNGVSFSTKKSGAINNWIIKKDSASKLVAVTEPEAAAIFPWLDPLNANSPDTEIEVEDYEEGEIGVAFFALAIGLDQAKLGDLAVYQNGKEYAVVYSKEAKAVTDENPVLGQKKDLIRIENEQLVIDIDKNYNVKSATYFYQSSVNRDEDTKEWYRKVKPTKTIKTSMKVTYGSLEARSENDLYNILAKEDKEIFVGAKPLLKMGYWDGTSATPAQASFTLTPELSDVEMNENVNAKTFTYHAHLTLSSTTNSILLNMNAEATYLTQNGFVTRTTGTASEINYPYSFTQYSTSEAGGSVYFIYRSTLVNTTYNFSFTLSLGQNISFIGFPTITSMY